MIFVFVVTYIVFIFDVYPYVHRNQSCGLDNSKTSILYEGLANIDTYPWMGTLFYPIGKKKITISVMLVAKQIVIGAANEIDILPKEDFRARSRVVLGHKCSGPSIKVLDYTFHPDYKRDSYTALAIVQLDVDTLQQELRPICPPPSYFVEPQIYAMVTNDCNKGRVRVYKMTYVPRDHCKHYYRKSGLDLQKYWPIHTVCARAQAGGTCRWHSGTALVIKQDGRWRLLGFGVNGPGCQAPARFLDYGMHQLWVRNSVARIGSPAISNLEDNHIIMRRSHGNLQRFGPCDPEEQRSLIYRDDVRVIGEKPWLTATYNLTLFSNIEYSCIILIAEPVVEIETPYSEEHSKETCKPESKKPKLYLRRWCANPTKICYGFQYIDLNFYVQINFEASTDFSIMAYGKVVQVIDPLKALEYVNSYEPPVMARETTYAEVLESLIESQNDSEHQRWFYRKDT